MGTCQQGFHTETPYAYGSAAVSTCLDNTELNPTAPRVTPIKVSTCSTGAHAERYLLHLKRKLKYYHNVSDFLMSPVTPKGFLQRPPTALPQPSGGPHSHPGPHKHQWRIWSKRQLGHLHTPDTAQSPPPPPPGSLHTVQCTLPDIQQGRGRTHWLPNHSARGSGSTSNPGHRPVEVHEHSDGVQD
jgi:hypothetical protein